ncbi:hypothetical protein Tco_0356676 [Tanacetum coccineum]
MRGDVGSVAFTSSGSSSSSDFKVDSCSKTCEKSYATLKEQYDSLSSNYKKSQFNLISYKAGLGYDAATAASPAVESFVNLTDKSGSDKAYHSVPLHLSGNFIPRKTDLTFIDEIVKNEANALDNNTSAPIIKDWNSDDESEIDYTVRPSTERIESVKTVRETDAPKQNKHNPRGNQRNWNNLMVERTMWNNSKRVIHKNFTNKMTLPHPKRSLVPQVVLTKSGKLSTAGVVVNTVRPVNTANTKAVNIGRSVNTAASKQIMNHPRTKTNAFKKGYSKSSRPFNRHFANKNSIINTNVNTARVKHTARDRAVGNPQLKEYKEKGIIDSGCSRHMT